ncbi:MAG TPA: GNAT family N-acetyltransferase [Polyangia bacterium]
MTSRYEIREANEVDALGLQVFMEDLLAERLPVLFDRESFPSFEEERAFVRSTLASGGVVFVAVVEEKIVGLIDFHPEPRVQCAHGGHFGMSVAHAHRGQGIGKALLRRLLDWTKEHRFTRVELQVFETNAAAIRLYEEMGFAHEGRRRRAVNVGKQKIDLLLMARVWDEDDKGALAR